MPDWIRSGRALHDDRGQVLPAISQTRRSGILRDKSEAFIQGWIYFRWIALILLATVFARELFHGRNPFIYVQMLYIWIVCEILRMLSLPRGFRGRVAAASMVRAGRCGTCGFGLTEIEAGHDGCVTCPECGSAWHKDRWLDPHPNAHALALRAAESPFRGSRAANLADDRGALLTTPMDVRAMWLVDLLRTPKYSLSPNDALLIKSFWQAKERAMRRFVAVTFVAAVLATTIAWFAPSDPEFRLPAAILIGVIAFAMVIVAVVVVAPNYVNIRQLALAHLRCPYCGTTIDPASPRQFDGCVQCSTCKAAWKLDGIAETQTGTAHTTIPAGAALTQTAEEPARD